MKVLLFGITNVGKTTTGRVLAKKLGNNFYDLDDEVKRYMDMSLEEFVHTGSLEWRDSIRVEVIEEILNKDEDMVFAICAISNTDGLKDLLDQEDIVCIELYDTVDNLFSRLVFSDENDDIYTDDEYKNEHAEHYLDEIQSDIDWYGPIFRSIGVEKRLFVNNNPIEIVADRIIEEYLK